MKCCQEEKKKYRPLLCLVTQGTHICLCEADMPSLKMKKEKKNINVGNERTIKRKMEAENLNKVCPALLSIKNQAFFHIPCPSLNKVRILDKVGQGIGVRTCTQRA
jgi:hypothetical protein